MTPDQWQWKVPALPASRWAGMEAQTEWGAMPLIGVFCEGPQDFAHELLLAGSLHRSSRGAWIASTFYPTGDSKLIDLQKDPLRDEAMLKQSAALVAQPPGTGNPYMSNRDSFLELGGQRHRGRARMHCEICVRTVEVRLERAQDLLDTYLLRGGPEISLEGLESLAAYLGENQ